MKNVYFLSIVDFFILSRLSSAEFRRMAVGLSTMLFLSLDCNPLSLAFSLESCRVAERLTAILGILALLVIV